MIDHLRCSKELFMLTYMDLNNVAAIHRGLNSWVDVRGAQFSFQNDRSVQHVPFNSRAPKQGAYKAYYEAWIAAYGADPTFGARWYCEYPYRMLESYPGLYVISNLEPHPVGCLNELTFIPWGRRLWWTPL